MITTVILLGIVTIFATINALQIYLNSTTIQKLKSVSSRLERLEALLGADSADESNLSWTLKGTLQSPSGVKIGSLLPSLELSTFSGEEVTLSSLIGAPALLLFLSTRCSVCINLFDKLLDYLDSAPLPLKIPSTVVILSESILRPEIDESDADGVRVLQAVTDKEVNSRYGITHTPCAIILDKEGVICNAAYMSNMEELFLVCRCEYDFTIQGVKSPSVVQSSMFENTEKPSLNNLGKFIQKLKNFSGWGIMIFSLLVISFVIRPVHVSGESMEPTLSNSTWVLVSPFATMVRPPTRDTIVVLRYPYLESLYLIKRVVAISGDCITLRNGSVFINDHLQTEPFVRYSAHYTEPQQCLMNGELYVLGDNRASSFDSAIWGPLPENDVAGILVLAIT